jgi:hypothetical protein
MQSGVSAMGVGNVRTGEGARRSGRRGEMNDNGGLVLPWQVIRQDDNGNRYGVGKYATRAEAQAIIDKLDDRSHKQLYWVERIAQPSG